MTDRDKGFAPDEGLETFFASARDDAALPGGDLLARIEAQALEMQPARRSPGEAGAGFWSQLRDALGGWKGVAGLTAACAAGLWLGIYPPEAMSDYLGQSAGLGTLGLDPLSGYDLALLEG